MGGLGSEARVTVAADAGREFSVDGTALLFRAGDGPASGVLYRDSGLYYVNPEAANGKSVRRLVELALKSRK